MFVQIHMLQSMPPGNLNRDDTGQPKKCIFGGVTRSRISSQCLKRNIRLSDQFLHGFGENLAVRTMYLPQIVGEELTALGGFEVDELSAIKAAVASKFKKENSTDVGDSDGNDASNEKSTGEPATTEENSKTPQLVFFSRPFAKGIARIIADFKKEHPAAYDRFIGKAKSMKKDAEIRKLVEDIFNVSKSISVDIGLFGRMTTSDLVADVEAACQVAHAISTHETFIESDYFTAMDDSQHLYATTQTETKGAAFLGSGETETFFNSAVYYKYFNIDLDALKQNIPTLSAEEAADVVSLFCEASALATPSGKQNSFAAHSVPELILVETSTTKRPISYANAFIQPVEGGVGRNLMTESARALKDHIDGVASSFLPVDTQRVLLSVNAASIKLNGSVTYVSTLQALVDSVRASLNQVSS